MTVSDIQNKAEYKASATSLGGGEGSAGHTALHAILACGGAAAAGGDCGTAALAASAGVVVNKLLDSMEGKEATNLTPAEREARAKLINTLVTGTTAALGGDAATAQLAAQIETENNALFLAIPAVEATIDAAIAGSAAAVRYCATNPACRQKAAELGISSVATVAVALGIQTANDDSQNSGSPSTSPSVPSTSGDVASLPPNGPDDDHQANNSSFTDAKSVRQYVNENAEKFGRSNQAYNVKSEADLMRMWNNISAEGKMIETNEANLIAKRLPDGTRVQLRMNSSTGGKTIDIKPANTNTTYRIHIEPIK